MQFGDIVKARNVVGDEYYAVVLRRYDNGRVRVVYCDPQFVWNTSTFLVEQLELIECRPFQLNDRVLVRHDFTGVIINMGLAGLARDTVVYTVVGDATGRRHFERDFDLQHIEVQR